MAAGRLPAPGTEFGPCQDPCEHRDCAATRETAARICVHCGKAIGYDAGFYDVGVPGKRSSVHAICEEEAIAAEQSGKPKV